MRLEFLELWLVHQVDHPLDTVLELVRRCGSDDLVVSELEQHPPGGERWRRRQ
jgi:hypothetical protein